MSLFKNKHRNKSGVRRSEINSTFKQNIKYYRIAENSTSPQCLVFSKIESEMFENFGKKSKRARSVRTRLNQ
jgi:hypothetical protein